MKSNYDIESVFHNDFNYHGMYYNNDHPDNWGHRTETTPISDTGFEYRFNSRGYRCDEFDQSADMPILFLGCSNTLGLGLPLENVWAHVLCNHIREKTKAKIPYWNLSKNGSSIDLQFLLLEKYIDQLQPKFIFFLLPPIYRRMFYYKNWFFARRFTEEPDFLNFPDPVRNLTAYHVDESAALYESHKQLLLINGLCARYNTQLFYQYWQDMTDDELEFLDKRSKNYTQMTRLKTPFPYPVDWARDRCHHGPTSHQIFADTVWEEVKGYF